MSRQWLASFLIHSPICEVPLRLRFTATVLFLSQFSTPVAAQAPAQRFGVGVSLDMTPTSSFTILGGSPILEARTGNIHFPVRVSRRLRIEPMLGYAKETQKSTSSGSSNSSSFSTLRFSVGLTWLLPRGSDFQLYAGPRLGLWRRRAQDKTTAPGFPAFSQTASQTNKFLSGVFGGEYFVTPSFSVGGEAQLTWTSFGDIDISLSPPNPAPPPPTDLSGSKWETAGLIVVRWFP
jgi:hypothetical protein